MNGNEPLSIFTVHQLGGDVASMQEGSKDISRVVEAIGQMDERKLLFFMGKANELK
ncbi:MAG: hypothetical protein AABX04_06935 [Nanoarchaeota archaeon]